MTIPLDISGTWLTGNNVGLRVWFTVASGTDYTTSTGTWVSSDKRASTNQINALDTIGNKFRIKNVQLEIGDKSTDFEFRPIGIELNLCKRYYQRVGQGIHGLVISSGNEFFFSNPLTPEMRAAPTVTLISTSFTMHEAQATEQTRSGTGASLRFVDSQKNGIGGQIIGSLGATDLRAGFLDDEVLQLDSEL